MRIITLVFIIVTLALSVWIRDLSLSTRFLSEQIKNTDKKLTALKEEQEGLLKYKSEAALSLDKFYLEVFNDIREICSYYALPCEIKIIEAKDLVNTQEFFRASQYKGIRCVDILCQVDLKDEPDTYLFNILYKMTKLKPIEVLEIRLEKNILNLTMRLFGP